MNSISVNAAAAAPMDREESPDLHEEWHEEDIEVSGSSYDEYEDEHLTNDALAAMLDGDIAAADKTNDRLAASSDMRSPAVSESPFRGEAVHDATPSPPPVDIEEDVEGDPNAVYESEDENYSEEEYEFITENDDRGPLGANTPSHQRAVVKA